MISSFQKMNTAIFYGKSIPPKKAYFKTFHG